ncbi:TetR/AcrR family transcriptional regulator [Mycolicibacterium bacteremicum]|uniref:TetR family transcriptional regulator n=1 Tax=Mycolicibacterium bacteremicum TaxID=564198 RepID=A0A1W9YWJ8_MYCBA|nr:TetR/AcrR family transcriptional regulator [Mycolicibacterium bacteremicum]MCV7431601.1 TetR/AcrR family transcriptional regulator [Mycolicibacterium bacteremicum]ORA04425.1 TetR family transcriptional regulator [Mycolicibacterium bacteremicum]
MKPSLPVRQRPRSHSGSGNAELAIFAALEALLAESSFQDVTVAQIIKRAKLSRANFYHYFASKYDVLVAMVARLLDEAYSHGPWEFGEGKSRERAMDTSLRRTIEMWTEHGAVVCAAVEHMHGNPMLAAAWNQMLERFVTAIAEQITYEREQGKAPASQVPPDLIARVLVCGLERSFYVGSLGLDPRIPDAESAVESIVELVFAATYGTKRPASRMRRRVKPKAKAVSSPVTVDRPDGQADSGDTAAVEPDMAAGILAAMTQVLAERSLDELSVADVLTAANASRASFYFYFSSKDDAFVALFRTASEGIASGFEMLAQANRADSAEIEKVITEWLSYDIETLAVARNAIHEWSRRPELRELYLATITRMTDTLEAVIEADRESGIAIEGPPAAQLAAVLMWTFERSFAGAMAGEAHLDDTDNLAVFLASLLNAVVYGR